MTKAEAFVWTTFWICCTMIILAITFAILYYNVQALHR